MNPDYIDLYCERLGPGLAGEPLNTLTNVFFLAAAFVIGRRLRDDQRARRDDWALAILVALVGVGSLVFHAMATRPTSLLDKLFIALFIWVFFQRFLVRVAGLGNGMAILGVVLFAAVSQALALVVPPDALNGSVLYLPALLGLGGVTAYSVLRRRVGAKLFVAATAIFLVAVFFRTIDQGVCEVFPAGTHFVWHSLNALVLFLCCSALRQASATRNTGAG